MTDAASVSITTQQVIGSLLAIPAFVPAVICPGYLAGWFTNLQGFRKRSQIERLFWSIPLSFSISPIMLVLIGWGLSLTIAAYLLLAVAVLWLVAIAREREGKGSDGPAPSKIRPYGWHIMALGIIWIAVSVLSLVDWEHNGRLYFSTTIYDHAFRVNWIESVLHSGVPPANSLYLNGSAAPMRYYFFWYVTCAAVARLTALDARSVFIASCTWAGFALAALIGLYLKHFLCAGARLRKQTVLAIGLLAVSGLDALVNAWNLLVCHSPLPGDLEWWSKNQVSSWLDSLLWVPHHIAGLVCCMLAFLLLWQERGQRGRTATVVIVGFSLASGFGLSVYVVTGFAFVAGGWYVTQYLSAHGWRQGREVLLASGVAAVLLAPFLCLLVRTPSGKEGPGSVFGFAVREMIPIDGLLRTSPFQYLATVRPAFASATAQLLLLLPGYALELGVYLIVLVIYLDPILRVRLPFSAAHRALLFLALATLPLISFIRSWVLESNDFGWRAALLLQFPLLLLASEIVSRLGQHEQPIYRGLSTLVRLGLAVGLLSTVTQGAMLRFYFPIAEAQVSNTAGLSVAREAYLAARGYTVLNRLIPGNAIVQYNPRVPNMWWRDIDMLSVNRQVAAFSDEWLCGSLWGGDPAACTIMANDLRQLYATGSAGDAARVCQRWGIDYLVAHERDEAWSLNMSWVWTLRPVVGAEGFRAVQCR